MDKIRREDLLRLEEYAAQRADFRARVMAHKQHRRVQIGPHLNLYFEDRLTMQYQVQEMLRIERIFEADGIEDELSAYNPLVPDGRNLKATAMLEYQDVDQRREALAKLRGIEHLVWLQVEGHAPVPAVSNEDLERSSDEKTSAVHFMRFEFDDLMIRGLRNGAGLAAGVDHENYRFQLDVAPATVKALLADFD